MSPTQNNVAIVAEDSFSGPGRRLLLFQKIRHLTLGCGFPGNRADTEPSARRVCFASHPKKANPAGRASSLPSTEAPVPSEMDRFPWKASSLRELSGCTASLPGYFYVWWNWGTFCRTPAQIFFQNLKTFHNRVPKT